MVCFCLPAFSYLSPPLPCEVMGEWFVQILIYRGDSFIYRRVVEGADPYEF